MAMLKLLFLSLFFSVIIVNAFSQANSNDTSSVSTVIEEELPKKFYESVFKPTFSRVFSTSI